MTKVWLLEDGTGTVMNAKRTLGGRRRGGCDGFHLSQKLKVPGQVIPGLVTIKFPRLFGGRIGGVSGTAQLLSARPTSSTQGRMLCPGAIHHQP